LINGPPGGRDPDATDFTDTAPDAMTAQPMSFLNWVSAQPCVASGLAHQVKSFEPMSLF